MKTIFITGTSSGLGKAAVKLFSANKWNVIATMRNPEKETELGKLPNVTLFPLDVSDFKQIERVVHSVVSSGKVDVVFNNAGYALTGPLESYSEEQIIRQVNTNQLGAILITKAFIPHFRERKSGLFITTTSIGGLVAFPLNSVYHATEGFNESLSFELKPFNIQVKTVSPGGIKSDFIGKSDVGQLDAYNEMFQKMIDMFGHTLPGSEPEEIAEVVYEAVTDGKDQLRYVAGADAIATYNRRLEIGAEAARLEIMGLFENEN
jgi:NAD(P)-dependent dehydrogenase (short-subunit alcohol dehydrogenase family)